MVPKTLLLTNHAPGRKSAGGVFLQNILETYPKSRICCFHTKPLPDNGQNPDLSWLPMEYGKAPTKYGLRRLGHRIGRYSRAIVERYFELVRIPRLVDKVVKFGKTHQVDLVLATLDSMATVRLAKPVAESLGVPLVVIVWDPPKYNLCMKYGLDDYSSARLLRTFYNTVRFAASCSVPSEAMKRCYEKEYGTECVVMVYGSRPNRSISDPVVRSDPEKLLVGFAGSIIADNVWDSFVSALAGQNWRISGREVVIRMHGARLNLNVNIPLQIEFRGWRSHSETIQSLSETDLVYLPYPLDDSYKEFVAFSFPSKMAAYMAAEVPVFYHGPKGSSASEFIEKFGVGVMCHSLDHGEIIESLESYMADQEAYQRARQGCKIAFEKELSTSVFRKRLIKFIGVREDELLPAVDM
ncbi:MAG: hypothetical protein ACN4GR_13595 [Arenicellales bacterium]